MKRQKFETKILWFVKCLVTDIMDAGLVSGAINTVLVKQLCYSSVREKMLLNKMYIIT